MKLLILSNFTFFPQCFPKAFLFNVLKWVYMKERGKSEMWLRWCRLWKYLRKRGENEEILIISISYFFHDDSLGCLVMIIKTSSTEPHSSVCSVADLRTGGRWFDPRLGQYSLRGLMLVIATFLSHRCPLFRHILCGKAASGLERILCGVLVEKTPGKHG